MCLHAGALKSRADWSNPCRNWRKREAYIALMRHVQKCPNYNQWDCFRFVDYTDRQGWARTFNVRHLPLSNGDPANFSGGLPNPVWWDNNQKQHDFTLEEPPLKRSKNTDKDEDGDAPMMMWDSEKQNFYAIS